MVYQINNEILNEDSRQYQWSKFYDGILNSPIIGNGYSSFGQSLDGRGDAGVHNSFLLILGESGLLPFLLIIMVFFFLFKINFSSELLKCLDIVSTKLS
jgi:O-antigen ligase